MIPAQQSTHEIHPIDGGALRHVCAHFATGVTVITTGLPGDSSGTTVNSFTSVSLEPPLVLFCLHQHSRLLPLLKESGGFVVNFLTRQQQSLAYAFAGRESADLTGVPHHRTQEGLPVLSEALAHLTCRLVEEYDGGDHTILLGRVVGLGAEEKPIDDPLIFYRGAMRELGGPVTVPPRS
ncbi:flavin reductase family protein [Streptomyces sp. NBC_00280]|uniref:flavin reductase family protein n=1 Tax=Streptomyces sp. NBC_00280 TaxID=2975699 RepID=UPI0032437E8F